MTRKYEKGDSVDAFARDEDDVYRWYRGTVAEAPTDGICIVRFGRGMYAGFRPNALRPVPA